MSGRKMDEYEKIVKKNSPEIAVAILVTMLRENVKRQNELKEEIRVMKEKEEARA